jgi:hypothetical protein
MKACIALVTVCLIVSLSILTLPVKAQEPLYLTVNPDGSVEPSTDLLESALLMLLLRTEQVFYKLD